MVCRAGSSGAGESPRPREILLHCLLNEWQSAKSDRGANDDMAESPGLGQANAARAERGVRCTTKHRRFLTLYTVPADFFMSIDSPGGRALGHRM
jgi:hypothetical protein